MTKVLVADDHDLVRMGIVRMLGDVRGIEVVGEACCGEDAVNMARKLSPDIVLMDVRMPGIGGLEATRKVIGACKTTKVIAVTSIADDIFPDRIMKAGASGYVTKGASFDEIVDAIKTVTGGGMYMSASIAQQLALRNCSGTKQDASPFDNLSERELQTSIMIANSSKVQEIADAFCVSPKTVNTYRYRIFEKLNVSSDVELVLLAIRYKLLELESPPA